MLFSFIFSLIFCIKYYFSNKKSISRLLYLFFLLLSLLSFFHKDIDIEITLRNVLNSIFILSCLIIIIDSFNNHIKVKNIDSVEFTLFQKRIILLLTIVGFLALVFNIYLDYSIYNYYSISDITIQTLKNESGADQYFKINFPRSIRTFTHLFSPLGYLFLVLHFFFLSKQKFKLSLIYLALSLTIPLHGMQGLSRAAPSQYILLYSFMYYYVNESFADKIRTLYRKVLIILFVVILIYLIITSYSRFSNAFYYTNILGGETNPYYLILYSFIDYLSQWIPYGIDSLNFYNLDINFNYSNFRLLYDYIISMFGFDLKLNIDHFQQIYGDYYASRFIGLVPTLIYDGGYIFTLLFVILFRILIYKKNKTDYIHLSQMLKLPLFLSLILMAFANAWLAYLLFHIAIVYTIIFIFFFKKRISFITQINKL